MTVAKKAFFLLLIILALPSLWAQNRFALVIGNADYQDPGITSLPNAINDTNDINAALRNLGFDSVLRQNLSQREMVREVDTFIARLRSNRNSEGFFWYAGHAMEISGTNLLLPLDVDLDSESLIEATSYSVTTLTRMLNSVGNKVNVIVLDACRVPPAIGNDRNRGGGDVTRLVKTIPNVPPGLLIIYSTASGTPALDGTGKNSPFTEAFLKHINSTLPLTLMVNHVQSETLALTNQRQQPYTSGSMGSDNIYYSLNPAAAQPAPVPEPIPVPSLAPSSSVVLGSITISSDIAGEILIDGQAIGTRVREGGQVTISNLETGMTEVAVRDGDGTVTKTSVRVVQGQTVSVAIEKPTNIARNYFERGEQSRERSAWDAAITEYSEAIRSDPNFAEAYRARGIAYHNKNDFDRAIADYSQDIRLNPNSAISYYNRGVAYVDKRDYDNAIASLTQAINIDPAFTEAYFERGHAYLTRNNYDAAILDNAQALRLDPNWAEAYFNRGLAHINKSNYDSAIADYTQAIRLKPNWAEAYQNRGVAYQRKGDSASANADLARARDLGYR